MHLSPHSNSTASYLVSWYLNVLLHGLRPVLNPLEFKSKMYSETDLQLTI